MISAVAPAVPEQLALAQRVNAVAEVLLPVADRPCDTQWSSVALGVDALARSLHHNPDPPRLWLALTALSTVMPDVEQFITFSRGFQSRSADAASDWLLRVALDLALERGTPQAGLQIVTDAVFVEVDFSARFNLHTGIQRVVRSVVPIWQREHSIIAVAWTPRNGAFRALEEDERERVLRWPQGRSGVPMRRDDPEQWQIVIPWRSTVVLPEVAHRVAAERLEAVARFSGNRVGAIGYDCIPVISADLLPLAEPNKFVHYLTLVKHMDKIAGISESAANEFRAFVGALPAQGLGGPQVSTCTLPSPAVQRQPVARKWRDESGPSGRLVLCVGSFEPRKNQLAVLNAAERLWREGLRFELCFVGGGGWGGEFPRMLKQLRRAGRPVRVASAISEEALDALYGRADFSVFPSLHEGYGLPVAESFTHGVPVITSDYGSTAEIAVGGGALTVDPRDDEAIFSAMRLLLTDETVVERLRAEIAKRPSRTWEDYAERLWEELVGDVS